MSDISSSPVVIRHTDLGTYVVTTPEDFDCNDPSAKWAIDKVNAVLNFLAQAEPLLRDTMQVPLVDGQPPRGTRALTYGESFMTDYTLVHHDNGVHKLLINIVVSMPTINAAAYHAVAVLTRHALHGATSLNQLLINGLQLMSA
ncbi:MAG TPA: hypothetical protein VK694_03160 [Verrucomicrobiae bacterium]|nr:hypothetical protein [Verrucomicrobiae bacterium]